MWLVLRHKSRGFVWRVEEDQLFDLPVAFTMPTKPASTPEDHIPIFSRTFEPSWPNDRRKFQIDFTDKILAASNFLSISGL